MTTMIERMARAIYETDEFLGDPEEAIAMARAALSAMLPLSANMIEAGRWPAQDDGPASCWSAMVQVDLNEKEVPCSHQWSSWQGDEIRHRRECGRCKSIQFCTHGETTCVSLADNAVEARHG